MNPNRFLALFLALALSLAFSNASAQTVNPKAEKELANVSAGIVGTCSTFTIAALAANTESGDLLAAPGAGTHYQFQWLDWIVTSAVNAQWAIMNEPSGVAVFVGKSGASATNINNFKPNILLNLNSNKAFRVKNLDGASALDIRINARWIVVND